MTYVYCLSDSLWTAFSLAAKKRCIEYRADAVSIQRNSSQLDRLCSVSAVLKGDLRKHFADCITRKRWVYLIPPIASRLGNCATGRHKY